jgi:hypothetical protein
VTANRLSSPLMLHTRVSAAAGSSAVTTIAPCASGSVWGVNTREIGDAGECAENRSRRLAAWGRALRAALALFFSLRRWHKVGRRTADCLAHPDIL